MDKSALSKQCLSKCSINVQTDVKIHDDKNV